MSINQSVAILNIKNQSYPIRSGKTLYVGGTGEGNYTKIQKAIDDASVGDTVFVYNGTYFESISIGKTINVIGENKNTTIIDNNKPDAVVSIYSNWVNFSGFTIQNNTATPHGGFRYGINMDGKYININSNIIKDNDVGIKVWGDYSNLENNIISNNDKHGILVLGFGYGVDFCVITNNTIYSNKKTGIYLDGCRDLLISSNYISLNDVGISLGGGPNNSINHNNILNNSLGLGVVFALNCSISCNNFLNNERNAYFAFCFFNRWNSNYWNRPRLLPKLIYGRLGINIDWNPAKEPYDF